MGRNQSPSLSSSGGRLALRFGWTMACGTVLLGRSFGPGWLEAAAVAGLAVVALVGGEEDEDGLAVVSEDTEPAVEAVDLAGCAVAEVAVAAEAGCGAALVGLLAVTHSLQRREAAGSSHCFFEKAVFSRFSSHALHTLPVDSVTLLLFSGLDGSVMASGRRAEG